MPEVRLEDLAKTLGRSFTGDGQCEIRGVGALESAGPNDLVYVRDATHHADLGSCPAGIDPRAFVASSAEVAERASGHD